MEKLRKVVAYFNVNKENFQEIIQNTDFSLI